MNRYDGNAPPSFAHLIRLTDDVGIVQHATYDIPNRSTGYCTDDVSRALIAAFGAPVGSPNVDRLQTIYLSFLHDAQLPDGRFHNFMAYDRRWLDEVGEGDANGRAIWSLGFGARFAPTAARRAFCRTLLERALPAATRLPDPHSVAFSALGLTHAYFAVEHEPQAVLAARLGAELERIAELLLAGLRDPRTRGVWFEPLLSYDSARLCEALLRIGVVLSRTDVIAAGLATFGFLDETVTREGVFAPIGSDGWYPLDGRCARFPQQPLEAAAHVDAASAAFAITGDRRYRDAAERAYAWFTGANSARVNLLRDGGCGDGIDRAGASANMGAESTIAAVCAAQTMQAFGAGVLRPLAASRAS